MPLFDHFHPPLSERRKWHSFHHAWATVLSFELNKVLPPGWFADPNVQFGIEIDVAAFDEHKSDGVASSWQPPAPTQTIPFALATDIIEVQIIDGRAGPTLAGAIELVSPTNKDRPESRDAFVSKCANYLQQAIGVVIVDVVTVRSINLHSELLHRLNTAATASRLADLWAASYRPTPSEPQDQLEVWHEPLQVGAALPVLPFWLKNGPCIKLDLEAAYHRTCQEQRMLSNGKQ